MKHDGSVESVAWSPDGTKIASGSGDKTVRVWDAATGHPVGEPMRQDNTVFSVTWSPDGTKIASGGGDEIVGTSETDQTVEIAGSICVWDAATGRPVGDPLWYEDPVFSVDWSPDGAKIASGYGAGIGGIDEIDGHVRVWDAVTRCPVGEPICYDNPVKSVAWSPDGTKIASGSWDKTVRVWDAATGRPVGKPMKHGSEVWSVSWSPDGTKIASGGYDETIRVRRVR